MGPGALLHDRSQQLGPALPSSSPKALRRPPVPLLQERQDAESSMKECEPADGRVPSLDATDFSPEQCRRQCQFAHELVAYEDCV